jgi:acetyltransferase, GNAT family
MWDPDLMSPDDRIVIMRGHDDLTATDLASLAALFDTEYRASFGPWTPERPYGYAGHDVHILARRGSRIVGHAGFQRRRIAIGAGKLTIAGVGGVLVAPEVRGTGLGTQLMDAAAAAMRSRTGINAGHLGCREDVVPFYESCGWQRIAAPERHIDRLSGEVVENPPGPPLLILPITLALEDWPSGMIDLRGRPW